MLQGRRTDGLARKSLGSTQRRAAAVEQAAFAFPLNVLSLSTLFPNSAQPAHGIFMSHRLKHLAAREDIALRVLAPVPWFPSANPMFGRYATYALAPREEETPAFPVLHPRYPVIPKVGMSLTPFAMALSLAPLLTRMRQEGFDFDIIDAYYIYPDGVAAALLGAWFDCPVTLTALGDDISLIPESGLARRQIQWAMKRADGLTAVCAALRDCMENLGVEPGRVQVGLHGVDLDLFRPPVDLDGARKSLGIDGVTLLTAGSLIPRKGHHIAIGALPLLPGIRLMIAGTGPMEDELRHQAKAAGVADRVTFLGEVSQDYLSRVMGAVDALALCSDREGIANVVMESLACGTPVIGTSLWGTPEIITSPEVGVLLRDRSPQALADGVKQFLSGPRDRAAARRHAEQFTWAATAEQHTATLISALRGFHGGA
jgi:glycosyltransferase involved in cell wall biosynthesis